MLSLSETLAAELSGTGINVTVLCPTFVKTNIVESGRISASSTQLADRLMRWTGFSPERVAKTCLDTNDPRRPVLHAAARCPNRLGHQTFHSHDLYPRCGPDQPRHPIGGLEMAIDMDAMLAKIKDRQWALADIDWDAPGAETISDEFRPKLKAFMADLCWIENVGARGFAALAKKAPTPVLAEIYRYFHAEEQRHANAELALMKRWGMLDGGEMPEPNVNIRLAIEWLDRYADDMSLSVLGTVIPMLEVALDGRAAEVPPRRGQRSRVPPGVREDQQRRVPAHRRRLRGAEPDRPCQSPQAGRRLRRRVGHPGTDHRNDHVRPPAQPDAQQHRRHGARAPSACTRP